MTKVLDAMNGFVWGFPALLLILAVGILLSVRTGWVQFKLFPAAMRKFFTSVSDSDKSDGISPYRALCTALAATVGTGNLAGVAGAIAIGGPGAIFWMWICAILGMVTKFAEATLSVHYAIKDNSGGFVGGPMYMVRKGMGKKWQPLAGIYCFFGVVAAFGVGSATQVNTVIDGINGAVSVLGGQESKTVNLLIGIGLAILVTVVLLGGAKRISSVAAYLVPFASVFYILLCAGVLLSRSSEIPKAFQMIFKGAFCPEAVTGGILGSAFQALRIGASRGVFTNEAGMGTAGIAHATARVNHPVEQGLMGIMEVFLDTIVICSMTALMILCSGIPIAYGSDIGIQLTSDALSSVYGDWVQVPLALALCCFAVATIFGWGLYGARCAQFLFGEEIWKTFSVLQAASVIMGAVLSTGTVWSLSETANGLMAIPNLIILLYLSPKLIQLTREYFYFYGSKIAQGGTNEHFNQCKPVRTVTYAEVPSVGAKGHK